jgi:hypothetical protein
MRIERIFARASVGIVATVSATAQGTFQNLDFEACTLPAIPPGQYGGLVPMSSAFPGWSTSLINGAPITEILQNDPTAGSAAINILGPNWGVGSVGYPGIIDRKYSAFIQDADLHGFVPSLKPPSAPARSKDFRRSLGHHQARLLLLQNPPTVHNNPTNGNSNTLRPMKAQAQPVPPSADTLRPNPPLPKQMTET